MQEKSRAYWARTQRHLRQIQIPRMMEIARDKSRACPSCSSAGWAGDGELMYFDTAIQNRWLGFLESLRSVYAVVQPSRSTKQMTGSLTVIAASALWSTLGIFAKLAYQYGIAPATLVAWRLTISSATLLCILALFGKGSLRIRRKDGMSFLVLGIFAVALQRVSYFYAVGLTTVTMAAILFYTYPAFVVLLASQWLKEKITTRQLLALALTFCGVALVVRAYDVSWMHASLIGVGFGLLSSLLFVVYFMVAKRLRAGYAGWTLVVFGDGIGAVTLAPMILFSLSDVVTFPSQLWLLILAIAWVPSLLGYTLHSHALKYVEASTASILSAVEPLSAALLSAAFLGERFEGLQMIGMMLALAGVVLLLARGSASRVRSGGSQRSQP